MSSPLPSPTAAAAEAPLVELTVSYAMVPPDDSFVRCAKLSTPAYIWAKRSDSGEPIVEIKLLKGEEAAPAEFKKLPEDLVRAADPKLGFFLAVRRGAAASSGAASPAAAAASPIVDLRILSDEEPVPEGFIKLEGDIVRAGDASKYGVYIKTRASKDKKQKELTVGDFIDVLDTVNKWCVGRIVDKNEKEVLVHYEGWSDKWNEWMAIKGCKRIAPFRTYTRGKDTGPESNDKAFVLTDNNLRDFQQCAARLDALADKPPVEFSDDDRQFVTIDVAKFVQNVLNAVIDDPEVLPHVPKFLKRVLQLIANYFRGPQEVPDAVVESFVRIFDGDPRARRFYNKYGLAIPKDKSMDKDGSFAKKPPRDGAGKELLASAYLIENINFFGEQGGFKLIVDRLLDQKRITSFHCLRMVIRAVSTVREHLLPAFAKDFVSKIAAVVVPRVQTITDDELKTIDREALNEVVRGIETLMLVAGLSAGSTAEFVEKTNLDISRRLMTCKLLEKRINGVQELRDTIDRVRRRDQPNWGVTNPYAPRPEVAKFLSPEYLVRWMNEQLVVEVLLGPSSHLELIRRAPAVLKFLAYQNALTPEDLDMLWAAGQGKHETVTRVVLDCVAELAAELTVKQLDQLFARVAAIPLNEYREVLLLFLKRFTINAVRNPSVVALPPAQRTRSSWYGLDIFWQLIQDNVDGLPADAAELSLAILGELLCSADFEAQKLHFLEKCVLNLKDQTSVAQALKLAKRVIDSYPIGVRAPVTVESLLHSLETKTQLLQLLINDFKQYNALAQKAIAERVEPTAASPSAGSAPTPMSPRPSGPGAKSLAPVSENTVFLGRYSHAVQMDTRLEFLDYVLSHSAQLTLSKEHVEVLWNTFVTRAVVPQDRNKLLKWLSDARDDANPREFTALNDEVTQFIFTSLLSNPERMDLPSISKRGYACFQFYFGYVNQALGFMEWPTKANRSRRMLVTKFPKLVGLDSLWTIAAAAVDPEVATLAGTLLIALHTRLDQALSAPEKKKEIFKTFVDKSMKLLAASYAAISQGQDVEANKRQAAQVVGLLETFLFQIEETFYPDDDDWRYVPPANPRQSLQLMVTVKENNSEAAGQRMTVNITSDNKIGVMRRELAKHLKLPPELIQFQYMGRVLYPEEYDDLSIGEARITRSRDAILAVKMAPEDKLSRPPEDAKSALPHSLPRLLLSNDHQYFELLFSLLKLGGRLGQGVWRLLMRLPTNVELSAAIKALSVKDSAGQQQWVRLFDPSAPLKLYYSMQILERLVTVKETDSDARRAEVQQWCAAFLEQGGLKHLFSAVMSWDLDELFADSIPQQCAAHVFSILLYFLTQRTAAQAEKIADTSVPLDKFLPRLLSIMNRTTTAARDAFVASAAAPVGEGVVDSVGETQGALLTQAVGLLINLVSRNPKTLAIVYAYPQLSDVFFQSLVCPVGRIRETALDSLLRFCALFDRPPPSAAELEAKSDAPPPPAPALPPLDPSDPSLLRPRAKLLPMLLGCLPQINTEHSFCGEYFDAISQLLGASRPEERGFDTATLSRDLAEKIVNHAVVEVRSSDNDTVLRGLLGLTRELVKADPSLKNPLGQQYGLINELFHNCLFALPSASTGHLRKRGSVPLPKCKSRLSREKAFQLLGELVRQEDTNFKQVLQLMLPLHMVPHTNGARPFDWEFEAKLEEKSETGYVGLKNPGCVCYMNSLMQQLFMIPSLRQQVLAVPDAVKGDEPPQDNFFHQLQFILAFLQESEKQYCDPSGFCHAFKDWEGQPTNINVQMDAQEFLNMLFDRIDTKVKGSPSEQVLKGSLGGTFSNELICKGCPHYKERREEFYAISVDVKNKKNLSEAMASFVEGEMLEGDNAFLCGVCNKKVDTLKRTCLKTLPPTVIFHLKRFEFDFEKMQKVKLNDRFEFPRRINLKPYTQEALAASQPNVGPQGQQSEDGKDKAADGKDNNDGPSTSSHPDEYYEYELTGVLVHTGSADRGHYYSFIRERAEGDEPAPERWFEFNDTFVRPFDPAQLEEECYGGEEARPRPSYYGAEAPMGMMAGPRNNQYNAQGQGQGQQMMEKYRNAYLLFYDRVKPATEIKVSAPEPLPSAPAALIREPSKVAVPSGILSSIAEQNITYSRDRAVYDPDYFNFVWDLVTNRAAVEDKTLALPASDNLSAAFCELLTRFVFDTLARAQRKESFHQFMSVLRRIYGASTSSCVWLLETVMQPGNRWLADLFYYCTNPEVRKQAAAVFLVALNTVSSAEADKLNSITYELGLKVHAALRSKETAAQALASLPLTCRLADRMAELLRDAPDHWKRFDQFFAFFAAVARVHPRVAHYLVSCNLPGRLVDFLLAEESPLRGDQTEFWKDSKGRRRRMGDEWGNVPDLSNALLLLSTLVCSVRMTVPPPPTYPLDPADPKPAELHAFDRQMLLNQQFLAKWVSHATSRRRGASVSALVCHLCWESAEVSEVVVGLLCHGIEEGGDDEIRPYFRTLQPLMALADSLQDKRVHMAMSSLLAVLKANQQFWRVTMLCTEQLVRICKAVPPAATWIEKNQAKLQWVVDWLEHHPRPPAYNEPGITLFKRVDRGQYSAYQYQPPATVSYGTLSAKQKQAAIFHIAKNGANASTVSGLEFVPVSDSDEDLSERVFEVGQWIDCKDTVNKWCEGTIVNMTESEVQIHYDGWADKWDEWLDRASNRIARYGRFTSEIPREKFKGQGPKPGDNIGGGKKYRPEEFAVLRAQAQQSAPPGQYANEQGHGGAEGDAHYGAGA